MWRERRITARRKRARWRPRRQSIGNVRTRASARAGRVCSGSSSFAQRFFLSSSSLGCIDASVSSFEHPLKHTKNRRCGLSLRHVLALDISHVLTPEQQARAHDCFMQPRLRAGLASLDRSRVFSREISGKCRACRETSLGRSQRVQVRPNLSLNGRRAS